MVQIIDDNLLEGVEQFTAQLSLPADQIGVMLGAAMTTVVITDNDSELHVDTASLCNAVAREPVVELNSRVNNF